MARKKKEAPPAIGAVVALHTVTFGKGQRVPAGSLFVPTSAEERDELFKLEAVREPTEAEAAVAAQLAPPAAVDADDEDEDEVVEPAPAADTDPAVEAVDADTDSLGDEFA